jgi:hypothetical protein
MRTSPDIPGKRWRLRVAATLALVVAVAGVVAVVLATRSPSTANGSSPHSQTSGSTTVQRRDLVRTDTESGTLSFASPQTVYNRLSGTITWLPAVGQVIKPGQALYKVGNEPAILMNGTTPAYRDLNSSDTAGPDILELNRNLVALGFNAGAIARDDEWQAATTEGVDLFQESLGETQTGSLTLGQVVFLPGDQIVSTVDATVGSGGSTSAVYHPSAGSSSTEFVRPDRTPRARRARARHRRRARRRTHASRSRRTRRTRRRTRRIAASRRPRRRSPR